MRNDLLALDTKALITLANRGLVKRAAKELAKGQGPQIQLLADGTLIGRAGALLTRFPPDTPFQDSDCSCGAQRACRHRVALVMAYQAQVAESQLSPPPVSQRPVFEVSEDMVRTQVGSAAYQKAKRQRQIGYVATVRFSNPPMVNLPTCSVTFLVPWQLAHVRCDCADAVNCHHLVMAVWALREVEDDGSEHLVTFSKRETVPHGEETLNDYRQFAEQLLRDGWSGSLAGIDQRLNRLRAQLKRARSGWLDDLLEELVSAIQEHDLGIARADATRCSALLNEMILRCRVKPAASRPQGHLHGEGTNDATKLDHTVLRGLGARYRVSGRKGKLSLFFRERHHQDVLVLEREWVVGEGEQPPTGFAVAGRKLLGTTVEVLAGSHIVTRGATRKPNRIIELRANRLQTSIMRARDRKVALVSNFGALRDLLVHRGLAELAPRIRASQVVAIAMGEAVEVCEVGYDPAKHTVWGMLAGADGTRCMVASEWLPEKPAGPALLAGALLDGADFMTVEASLRRGMLYLEPIAISRGETLQSLDLQQSLAIPELPVQAMPGSLDPVNACLETLGDWLHSLSAAGLAHLTGSQLANGRARLRQLEDAGFSESAMILNRFLQQQQDRVNAWQELTTRVLIMTHLLTQPNP